MGKSKMKKRPPDPLEILYPKRDKALERVVAICSGPEDPNEDPDELNKALDVLALAHITATFEFVG